MRVLFGSKLYHSLEKRIDMFLRMGGFHRLKNFMGVIGRRMEDSGFEDIFLEAGIYGATQMSGIVKAKCYNRTLSAHKVLLEALMRIYWNNFADWIEEDINVTNEEKKHIWFAGNIISQRILQYCSFMSLVSYIAWPQNLPYHIEICYLDLMVHSEHRIFQRILQYCSFMSLVSYMVWPQNLLYDIGICYLDLMDR